MRNILQGEQPHCGLPERKYHTHAERLARAGLKAIVVEQTETPDQLRIRNEERKANMQSQVAEPCPTHCTYNKLCLVSGQVAIHCSLIAETVTGCWVN